MGKAGANPHFAGVGRRAAGLGFPLCGERRGGGDGFNPSLPSLMGQRMGAKESPRERGGRRGRGRRGERRGALLSAIEAQQQARGERGAD